MFSMIELIKNNNSGAETLDTIGVLDIGAMFINGIQKEYSGIFNQGCARVVGFEPVETECNQLNHTYKNTGMQFLPYFIGDGTRQKFYLTNHSMTSSLYEPNTPLLNMFQNLGELTVPVSEEWVETKCLDDIEELNFPVDFIKIDIQGAELQAFQSAQNKVLKDVLVIQTEVEWVPLYKNQPLFSELEIFLREQGFSVHKIMGFGTRSFKPTITHNINVGIQNLWSDVIFVRDFTKLDILKPQQLLKMAVLLHDIYQSVDLALIILKEYDRQKTTSLADEYQARLTGTKPQADIKTAPSKAGAPTDFVSLYSLGVEAFNSNNYSAALEYFEAARAINSSFAPLWHNLGITTAKLGRFNEALQNLDQAIKLDPSNEAAIDFRKAVTHASQIKPTVSTSQSLPSGHADKLNIAIGLQSQNKLDEAEVVFQDILASNPSDAAALFSMGGLEYSRRNLNKALDYFNQCMSLKPDFAPLWHNLGIVQQALKQSDKALASYDKALEINPAYTEVMLNRGTVLVDLKRHKDALLNYEELIKLEPTNDKALCNRGIILSDFKLNDLAIDTFARLIAISPEYDYALGLLSFAKMHACDWNNLPPLNQAIIEGVRAGKRVCKTLAFTAITPEPYDHLLCAQIFGKHYFPTQQPLWRGEIYHHAKIKIAYVSPDLREHPVGHLTAGIFEHHDKNKFETIAISLGIDDNSRLRARMLESFDEFIDARQITSSDIAKLLREKEVDILVDLAGYTADSRTEIFSYRPAPIQVNYLGYSSTMGLDYIDYIIADRHIIPESARESYSEKIVYLPDTYLPTDSALKIADTTLAREEYGLPATGFVFCSFNHDYKINPPMFDIWMRLLKAVPDSVLWLMKLNESAERNLRKEAAARDIDPSRIIFATRVPNVEDHLARYRAADLFLDTFPCNAHTTSSDVLRAGLPLITCRGKAFAGRVASGLLTLVGLPELITENLEDYEKLALQLATQKNKLQKIRTKLDKNLKNNNPFDTDRYCRNLELAFDMMYQRYLRGEAPEHLIIDLTRAKT